MKAVTTYFVDGFELHFEPIEDTLAIKKTEKGYEVKYLAYDDYFEDPFEYDGSGRFYHWKDYGREQLQKYCELLGYDMDTRKKIKPKNPLAVEIDKYEHGQIYYSISGEGYQCRWDTSRSWAVWYPDDSLLQELNKIKNKTKRRKKAIEYARRACELFNQWANGDVYILVKEIYNEKKEKIDYDCCGGYFGYKEALKSLETEI